MPRPGRPRGLLRRRSPALSTEAHRVLQALRQDGVARTSLDALVGTTDLLDDVLSRTDDLIADQSADIVRRRRLVAGEPASWPGAAHDPHDVELLGTHPPVDPEDPYARFLRHPQISGIAGAHCGFDVRIWDMNGLLTLAAPPRPDGWTRSPDGPAVEVSLLLSGVDDGAGPFDYVRCSHRSRGARSARALERTGRRIADADVARVFGPEATTSVLGGTGTLLFVDPRGLHRRRRPTVRDRLVLQGRFAGRSGRGRAVLLPADAVPRSALADFALA